MFTKTTRKDKILTLRGSPYVLCRNDKTRGTRTRFNHDGYNSVKCTEISLNLYCSERFRPVAIPRRLLYRRDNKNNNNNNMRKNEAEGDREKTVVIVHRMGEKGSWYAAAAHREISCNPHPYTISFCCELLFQKETLWFFSFFYIFSIIYIYIWYIL